MEGMRIARNLLLMPLLMFAISSNVACQDRQQRTGDTASQSTSAMKIQSSAFAAGAAIPSKYTCSGENVSPPLAWSGVPEKAKSLVLIVHDPDAPSGDYTHWLLYAMPGGTSQLAENVAKEQEIAGLGRQGTNDFRKIGYGGPCPPPGKPHRYLFHLYALDVQPDLAAGARRAEVESAIRGHVVAEGELMGTFGR